MKQYSFHSFATLVVVGAVLGLHTTSAGEGHHKCMQVFKERKQVAQCCSDPPLLDFDDNAENCVKTKKDEGKDMRVAFACCARDSFKEKGFLDANDGINKEALEQKADTLGGDWAATNKETITKCIEKANKMKERHGGEGGECDPTAAMFAMCIGKEFIKKCPKWGDSELCTTAKQCAEMKPPRKPQN